MFATSSLKKTSQMMESAPADSEIVEVSLLLPRWQIQAMESVAHQRGMNLGQMLRRMIGATFAPQSAVAS